MAAQEPDAEDELLVELLAFQARGDQEAILDLLENAGERADALRSALALTAEIEDLGRLLTGNAGSLPDEIAHLGRFENLRPIADGGLARVYRARDPRLERDVALKILHPDHAGADAAREWILAEGRALAGIQHDSVVRVFEVDDAEGFAYVAMELVDGPHLHDVLSALRELEREDVEERHASRAVELARALAPVAERLRLVRDLADALESCHARGIVHRDVKPANVLLDEEGTPKLIDFGLAHRVEASTLGLTQQLVGTPGYLAPEQVESDRTGASPRSDQFSLSTLLYELLTLHHPFQSENRAATMHAVARAAPTPPRRIDSGLTADVERVCMHGLEREPADRYSSLGALRDDLDAILELRPISLSPDTIWRQTGRWSRKHVRSLVVAAVFAVVWIALTLMQGASARGEVLGALDQLDDRIEHLEHADQAQALYTELLGWKARAIDLDSSNGGRMIHGAVMPPLVETALALARHCGELIDAEVAGLRASTTVEEQKDVLLSLLSRWGQLVGSEVMLLGESAPNPARLDLGTASVPENCTVWRLTSAYNAYQDAAGLFDGTDIRSLPVGEYRAIARVAGEIREVEFVVEAWHRARAYVAREYRCDLELWSVETPPEFLVGEKHVLKLAPYEITAEALRWRDVVAALGREESEGLMGSAEAIDDFVGGSWNFAADLARRMGARLPTPLELHVLRGLGHDAFDGPLWTSVRTGANLAPNARIYYDAGTPMEPLPEAIPDLEAWVHPMAPDGTRSVGAPRIYLARSRSLEPTRISRR